MVDDERRPRMVWDNDHEDYVEVMMTDSEWVSYKVGELSIGHFEKYKRSLLYNRKKDD